MTAHKYLTSRSALYFYSVVHSSSKLCLVDTQFEAFFKLSSNFFNSNTYLSLEYKIIWKSVYLIRFNFIIV